MELDSDSIFSRIINTEREKLTQKIQKLLNRAERYRRKNFTFFPFSKKIVEKILNWENNGRLKREQVRTGVQHNDVVHSTADC